MPHLPWNELRDHSIRFSHERARAIFQRHIRASLIIISCAISLVLAHQAPGQPCDAAPPTYRKICLNGRVDGDKMPQDVERTDQESEETYIDALTLQLRHATTEVFVPLATNLPELMVRRNAQSLTWPAKGGLPPDKRPDLPFGNCWTSGLAANIHILDGNPGTPVYAEVTDEQGMVHKFVEIFDQQQQLHFCPLPSPDNEQETTAMTLEKNAAGDFVFRRKFGTTLVYTQSSRIEIEETGAAPGENPLRHSYFRLATMENLAGSMVSYIFYNGNHGLLPDEIAYFTQRIHIERNARGQAARIIDPVGGDILCEYRDSKLPAGGALLVGLHFQKIDGVRAATLYDYDEATEPAADGQQEFLHCDLSHITDPRGKTYVFDYEFDHSSTDHGLPRCVRKVTMPDGIGTTEFFNLSKRNPYESKSVRMTYVRDAVGNGRLYQFLENSAVTLDASSMGKPGEKIQPPQFAVFKRMEISNFQGSDYHYSEKDGFVPDAGTKLLGSEECQFDTGTCMGLVQTTDLSGNVTHYSYGDKYSNPSNPAWMPANPFAVHRRDITEYVKPLGGKQHYEYDGITRILTKTVDEDGHITENEIDRKRGLITAIRTYADADSLKTKRPFAATEWEYGDPTFPAFVTKKTIRKIPSPGSPKWETDLVTSYEPNVLGQLAREIRNPGGLNLIFRYGYDLNENKLFTIYPNGYVVQFTYDARNRLIRADRPSDAKPPRELSYDLRGNKIREIQPDGETTDIEYDGISRVVKKTVTRKDIEHGTKVFKFTYNAVNSKTFDTNDDGETSDLEFDGLQRATKIISADGRISVYDYGKNCGSDLFDASRFRATRAIISPDKELILNEYNANCQREKVTKTKRLSLTKDISEFEYDPAGNEIRETAPDGSITSYEYDPFNRLIKTILPTKKIAQTFYTSTGLKYGTTDGSSERTDQEFDAAGYVVDHPH